MNIIVENKIIIQNPTSEIQNYCWDNLVLDNPDYYKKERMGLWLGNTPPRIWLFEKIGDELWLPFGCLHDLWQMYGNKVSWSVKFAPISPLNYKSLISLYPYQEKAVNEAIRAKNGILVMPCGSGKTQCGLEIISRLGGRALWLTHTQDLLNQSKSRAEAVLECSEGAFGTITAGKVHLGTHITFATVQTLSKLDLTQYSNLWEVIIVDEAQHCAGSPTKVTQFYKVVSALSARYKIGLTATPKRADGLERAMFAILGDKIHEVTREEVAHTTCPVRVESVETGWMPDYDAVLMGDGTIDYSKVIENMIADEKRFEMVMKKINSIPDGCPIMVLANRVAYLKDMLANYEKTGVCLSGQVQSKKAKAERKEALNRLNNGEIDCVFATYQLAKEGLDVPNLRYVVFATPEKDSTTIIQAAGRVGRKAKDKDFGTVIDLVDDFGMYRGWYKKRLGYYRKIGAEVL